MSKVGYFLEKKGTIAHEQLAGNKLIPDLSLMKSHKILEENQIKSPRGLLSSTPVHFGFALFLFI